MNLLHNLKIRDGWHAVGEAHLSVLKTFLLLALPFSLIPPLMLIYAGNHHAASYLIDASPARWTEIASAFLIAELITVPLMGWVIKSIAATHHIEINFKDAFLLATISALPMWLSAFGLAIPHLWGMIGIIVSGFFVTAIVLYRGSFSILKLEQIEAQLLSSQVLAVGGIVWVLLCAFVVLPLLS